MKSVRQNLQHIFDRKTQEWLRYTESPGGTLRHIVILHHVRAHALSSGSLDVLDVGGGTGEIALDLAREGHAVKLLDISSGMIEQAQRRSAGLKVDFVCAAADSIPTLFDSESFDLVLCHSLLEFVKEPLELLGHLMHVLRRDGLLSVVVGNRHHFPLRAALLREDFREARLALDEEIPASDLFGLPQRSYSNEEMQQMIRACDARLVAEYGVRVFMDLLQEVPELTPDLIALELAASSRLPYRHMARFIQFIAAKG
jgi:ubiquinone/menaquinone biosynthesis C-methylase UbiE